MADYQTLEQFEVTSIAHLRNGDVRIHAPGWSHRTNMSITFERRERYRSPDATGPARVLEHKTLYREREKLPHVDLAVASLSRPEDSDDNAADLFCGGQYRWMLGGVSWLDAVTLVVTAHAPNAPDAKDSVRVRMRFYETRMNDRIRPSEEFLRDDRREQMERDKPRKVKEEDHGGQD